MNTKYSAGIAVRSSIKEDKKIRSSFQDFERTPKTHSRKSYPSKYNNERQQISLSNYYKPIGGSGHSLFAKRNIQSCQFCEPIVTSRVKDNNVGHLYGIERETNTETYDIEHRNSNNIVTSRVKDNNVEHLYGIERETNAETYDIEQRNSNNLADIELNSTPSFSRAKIEKFNVNDRLTLEGAEVCCCDCFCEPNISESTQNLEYFCSSTCSLSDAAEEFLEQNILDCEDCSERSYSKGIQRSTKDQQINHSTRSLESEPRYSHPRMSNDWNEVENDSSVRVAVRIRPQNSREVIDMCRVCTNVTSGEPQIVLGLDKGFTFDYVFDVNTSQTDIYSNCVERLVEGALHGYNATVFAYGQTGSGKTFTMGTGFDRTLSEDLLGIIPRAVSHIFAGIEEMQEKTASTLERVQYCVAVQFLELYNEDIIDLLDPFNKCRAAKIHEDVNGEISVSGVTIKPIYCAQEAMKSLQQGALARTTASTKMNDQSSRSHAIFTILIRRQRVLSATEMGMPEGDMETLTSKFHFVDLAGSERLKRTGATGERARESISINCGLLSLGNCISALGDKSKRATHVPYRDSKLTRLLQDSLGGNSQTIMIACVSPSDRDFMETLNTLKYANRARNIKNKVQLNKDQNSSIISKLRTEIASLQLELLEFKQGKRLTDGEGNSSLSDTCHENALLLADNKRLQQRLKAMQETINVLTDKNANLKLEKEMHGWSPSVNTDPSITVMVAGYLSEIEKLQAKLIESEEMYQQTKTSNAFANASRTSNSSREDPEHLINLTKRTLQKNREMLLSRSVTTTIEDNRTNIADNEMTKNACISEESDSESDDKTHEMQNDLNDVNSDIEIKTKLVEQLELSQQRMHKMRQHYEDKLSILQSKIANTQKERDDVLANMGSNNMCPSKDKIEKVRSEYEKRLNGNRNELKKLQLAQQEHLRQQREMKAQEVKVRYLKNELFELKKIKARLISRINEQMTHYKEQETRKSREIAQLKKDQRRQHNEVKSLQFQINAKDQILRRKTEEVSALRYSQRSSLRRKQSSVEIKLWNTRKAQKQWKNIYREIEFVARNRQMIVHLEKELERLMSERDALSSDLCHLHVRQQSAQSIEMANEEDNIKSNLNYIQENIAHVQQTIMEFEDSKDSVNNGLQILQTLFGNVQNLEEAKFYLDRLTDSAIGLSCNSALLKNRFIEQESLLKDIQQENSIQQQVLQHFLSQHNAAEISVLFESLNLVVGEPELKRSGSHLSLHSNKTYDIPSEMQLSLSTMPTKERSLSPTPTVDFCDEKMFKVRRQTAQRRDLLYGPDQI